MYLFTQLYSTYRAASGFFYTQREEKVEKPPEKREVGAALEEVRPWPEVAKRQFAMRFLGSHLNNTALEGSWSTLSVAYWCHLIEAWLSQEGHLIPYHFNPEILLELHGILKGYGERLDLVKTTENPKKVAEALLEQIKGELQTKGFVYIGLGYTQGPHNQGHAIPIRIELTKQFSPITVHFLNLGEGVHMNPEVSWDTHYPRRHFRGFPATFSEKEFFEKGIELFARQISLMNLSPSPRVSGLDATDILSAFYSVGLCTAPFSSDLLNLKRAKKAQTTYTCADEAVELLIRDFLIEKGVPQKEIQRFFCNEKLCALLRFSHSIKGSTCRDDWVMFQKGIQDFSISILKKNDKAVHPVEVQFCKECVDTLLAQASEGAKKCAQVEVGGLKVTELMQAPMTFPLPTEKKLASEKLCSDPRLQLKAEVDISMTSTGRRAFATPQPSKLLEWILEIKMVMEGLQSVNLYQRNIYWLFHAFQTLPIPRYGQGDYWDQVPAEDIPAIVEALCAFTHIMSKRERILGFDQNFQNLTLVLHQAYTIVDRLLRRIHPELKGYCPPFFRHKKTPFYPEKNPQFPMLAEGSVNQRWKDVSDYFERLLDKNPSILFAFHDSSPLLDIRIGVKTMRDVANRGDPTASHMRFLSQFFDKLPKGDQNDLARGYTQLWYNLDCQYLPESLHHYQYLALQCWRLGAAHELYEKEPAASLCHIENGSDTVISYEKILPKKPDPKVVSAILESPGSSFWHRTTPYTLEAKSENDALCLPPCDTAGEKNPPSLQVQRAWARLSQHPTLQITSTLQWIFDHLPLIRDPTLQKQIEKKLFAPDALLIQRLKEAPQLAAHVRRMIKEGISFYSEHPKDVPHRIFFIRLGIAIETHITQAGLPGGREVMQGYESLLLKYISEESNKQILFSLYCHLRFLYTITLPRQDISLKEMIKAGFWLEFSRDFDGHEWTLTPIWVEQAGLYAEDCCIEAMTHAKSNPHWVNGVCQEVFHVLFPKLPIPQGEWKGTFPLLSCQEYCINVQERIVVRNQDERLWCFNPFMFLSICSFASSFPEEFKKKLAESEYRLWLGKNGYHTYDGTYRFALMEGSSLQIEVCTKITIDGCSNWYKRVELPHPLFKSLTSSKGCVWERSDQEEEYCVVDPTTGLPLYFVSQSSEGLAARKCDARGGILPYKLLNLEAYGTPFFTRLGLKPTDVLCWVDGAGKIESLEMVLFKLKFTGEKNGEQWVLRCCNYPDFILSPNQSLPELDTFNGGLVLENALGEKCVLIAPHMLERKGEDFTTQITLTTEVVKDQVRYYLYRLDPHLNTFLHEEPEANVFLAYLFASMRNYKKALYYLQQGRSFSYNSTWCDELLKLRDQSPEARAFALRAALFLFQNHSQVTKGGYGDPQGWTVSSELIYKTIRNFEGYLRYASAENSRIPGYIRLSLEEEFVLLSHLEQRDKTTPHLLKMRKTLIKEGALLDTHVPSTWTLSPRQFTELSAVDLKELAKWNFNPLGNEKENHPFNPFFVRMTRDEIQKNFPTLFQRALFREGGLDLLYLAKSPRYNNETSLSYVRILQIVGQFPSEFYKYKFGKDHKENVQIFEEILQTAIGLQKKCPAAKTCQVNLSYASVQQISLSSSKKLAPTPWEFQEKVGEGLVAFHKSLEKEFLLNWAEVETKPLITDTRPFIFDVVPSQVASPTLISIVKTFQQGYGECLDAQHGRDHFALKKGKDIAACQKEAETLLKAKKLELEVLRQKAEGVANAIPANLFLIGLKKAGADLPPISIEEILTDALESENPSLIRAANPSLSQETVYELIVMTMRYHILNCHISQLSKGIKALLKGDVQDFGEAVAVYGAFDPTKNPELLIYQSKTKLIARKEQAAFIEWIKQADLAICKVLLFEVEAGGGKGTFFTPILKKQLKKLGFFPISTSPASLYQVERKKQRVALKRAYNLNLEVMELTLNTTTTDLDFKWIYHKLLSYSKHDTLKIIPECYFALDLKYQLGLESRDVEQVRYLSLILDLIESTGAGLIDEGRLNLSPFTQAQIGIGKKRSLSSSTHKLFIHLYKAMVDPKNRLPDGRKVCEVIKLTENKQAMMSKKESAAVRLFLIQHMAAHPFLQIPQGEQAAIIAWWTDKKAPKPKWLLKEAQNKTEIARLILETGKYFHTFYDFVTQAVGQMRHARSLQADEEIDVPARRRKATKSYFSLPWITLILTIQGTLQRGLSKEQCKNLIQLLQETREIEIVSTKTPDIDAKFAKWMQGTSLVHLNTNNRADVETLYKALHRKPEVIFWYLEKAVLPQVTYSTEQLTVTPQHFLHAFKTSIVYSAFLGPTEAYGVYDSDKHVRRNRAFAAHVIHQLTAGHNQEMHILPSFATPLDLLNHLWKVSPHLFKNLRMLIDVGGMLRDFSSEEIAAALFAFMKEHPEVKYDGVILFQDAIDKEEESDMMVWLKGEPKPVIVPQGEIISGLAALGYKWEDLKLLTIIDPSHATGSDIVQPEESTAFVMLGEGLSIGDFIQGVMRLRGFLGFLKKQNIVWGVLQTLADQIAENYKKCTTETALYWTLENEAKTQSKEIELAAYQVMDYLVQKLARAEFKQCLHQPEKQIELWHQKHRKGFVKPFNIDPFEEFNSDEQGEATDKVLAAYAKNEYAQYGYPAPWELSNIRAEVTKTGKSIAAKIPKLTRCQELGKETQLFCHQDLKKEQEKIGYSDLAPDELPPLKEEIHLYQPGLLNFMTSDKFSNSARKLFNSKGFSDNLFFSHKYIHTAKSAGVSLKQVYLKPAQYFLIIYENKELRAFVLSDEEAAFFQEQLIRGEKWLVEHQQKKGSVSAQAALFTADGVLAQNGPPGLALSQEQLADLLKHSWFEAIVTDIGLISCTLRNMASFVKRAEKWEGLSTLWTLLKSYQPNPETLNTSAIDRCIATATTKKKKSLFF